MDKLLTLLEVPSPSIEYIDKGTWKNAGPVVTNTYRPTQHLLSAILKEVPDLKIQFVDMKSIPNEFVQKPITEIPLRYHHVSGIELDYAGTKVRTGIIGLHPNEISDIIKESDFLGFTSNFLFEWGVQKEMYRYAKEVNPDVKIIVGGRDASAQPESYLRAGADIVIMRSGLDSGREVFNRLNNASTLAFIDDTIRGVDGVSYLTNSGILVLGKELNHHPNNMPFPDFDLVNVRPDLAQPGIERYIQSQDGELPFGIKGPVINYRDIEGCNFSCGYCTEEFSKLFKAFIEKVIKGFEKAHDAGFRHAISGADFWIGFPKSEQLAMMDYFHEKDWTHEFGNGLNLPVFINWKTNKVDINHLEKILKHKKHPDGSVTGTVRTYCAIEDPTDKGIMQRKLPSWDTTLALYEAIASFQPEQLGFGLMISPYHDESDVDIFKKRMEDLMERVKTKSKGQTGVRSGVYAEIPIPGTSFWKKYQQDGNFAFNPRENPEFFHLFMGGLNGKMSYDKVFRKRIEIEHSLNHTGSWQKTGNYLYR